MGSPCARVVGGTEQRGSSPSPILPPPPPPTLRVPEPPNSVTLTKAVGDPEVVSAPSVQFAYSAAQTPVVAAFPQAVPAGGVFAFSGRLVSAPSRQPRLLEAWPSAPDTMEVQNETFSRTPLTLQPTLPHITRAHTCTHTLVPLPTPVPPPCHLHALLAVILVCTPLLRPGSLRRGGRTTSLG